MIRSISELSRSENIFSIVGFLFIIAAATDKYFPQMQNN
jgi:hypothetical protein